MRPEDLIKPISPDAPCGDDLLMADDPDFVDYYFNVEDRFPTSYFNVVRGTLFDPRSLDLKSETAQIDPLLKRSRDLRLLGIEAKFQILTGRFKGFVDTVQGMAALLETYPDDVHPVDPQDRRNAIEELNASATIVAPLEYAPLLTDKRVGDITYRAYATGTGKITLREEEEPGNSANITSALGSSENAKSVETLHQQLTGLLAALATMTAVCLAGPSPASPQLARLEEKLRDLLDMVLAARPDLGGEGSAAAPSADGTTHAAQAQGTTTFTLQATSAEVPDHRAAYRLLRAVETYFATTEPSSLALLLVVQARLLVGRPLVEALDVLVESNVGYAAITFGADTGFSISMNRMRDLSYQANIPAAESWAEPDATPEPAVYGEEPFVDPSEVPVEAEGGDPNVQPYVDESAAPASTPAPDTSGFLVLSRDHAGLVLKQVEEFYQIREPASPIPILLFKARNMLTKDFHALVRELMPPQG